MSVNNQEPWNEMPIFKHNNYLLITQNNNQPTNFVKIWIINTNTYQTYSAEVSDTAPVPIERFAQLFFNCASKYSNEYSFNIEDIVDNNSSIKIILEINSVFIPYRKEIICFQNLGSQHVTIDNIINFARYYDDKINQLTDTVNLSTNTINQLTNTVNQLTNTLNQLEHRVTYLENTVNQQNITINNFINRFGNTDNINNSQNNIDGPRNAEYRTGFRVNETNQSRNTENGSGLSIGSIGMIPVLPVMSMLPFTLGTNIVNDIQPPRNNIPC